MTTTRWQAALVAGFAAMLLAASAAPSAQSTPDTGLRPPDAEQARDSGRRARGSAPTPDSEQTPDSGLQTSEARFVRPIFRIGQDYTLRGGDVVRELFTAFADVTLEGRVEHQAVTILGSVHVKSTAVVDRSLVVIGGSATIDQGAVVNGDLVVVGGTLTAPSDFSPRGEHVVIGSPALGNALNSVVPWFTRGLLWGRLIVPDITWIWVLVGIVFLVSLAVNLLFDRPVQVCADAIGQKPFSTFLLGLLVLVLAVPALVVLSATVIGIAVVPFVVCAMFIGGLIGKVGVDRAIGRGLVAQPSPDSRLQSLRSFLLGFVVIGLAYMVPLLGVVTWALTTVFAVGAAAAMLRAMLRREHPPRLRAAGTAPAGASVTAAQAATGEDSAGLRASGSQSWHGSSPATAESSAADRAEVPLDDRGTGLQPGDGARDGVVPPRPAAAGDLLLYPRATFLDRVAAFALDCVLIAIAVQALDLAHDGRFPLVLFIYHVAFWAWKGTTLGGIVVGLRVVRTTGGTPRFVDALVRGLASILSFAALGIGCFWMLQDPERQMWHDKIAGTVVNKVPREVALA